MIIDTIHIKNFRCVADHSIKFEKITSFIGPNGAGKSTVLRALDWVFNSAKDSLAPTDVFGAFEQTDKTIAVTVTFTELTPRDREVLTERYAPPQSDTFSVRREWSSATGDHLTGASKGFPAFAAVRRLIDGPAGPVKSAYDDVREQLMENSIVLPEAKTKPAIIKAIDAWEQENPGELVLDFVTDNQMFGFAGQGELAKIFTYVFVDADLRAYDEAEDSSKTILGKLLSRALDRSPAEAALTDLANEVTQKHNAINDEHLGPQLETISQRLSEGINRFTAGRNIKLQPQGSLYAPPKAKVDIRVIDKIVETPLTHQGHGFQRAALVASLQVLAEYSTDSSEENTLFLAIEEPELFQHPTQARAFSSVLRKLAGDADRKLQIAYATHSLYFVDPFEFHEVRRVSRDASGNFKVSSTTRDAVSDLVQSYMSKSWTITSEWSKLILLDLREALFANAVVLCEGADDAAVLEGASNHTASFDVLGITATSVRGKNSLFLPQIVLKEFGIPVLVIWDNDSDVDTRAKNKKLGKLRKAGEKRDLTEIELADIQRAKHNDAAGFNKQIAEFMGVTLTDDYPKGLLSRNLYAVEDTLETMLSVDWPEFFETRQSVIDGGDGVASDKHEATYRLAAQQCATPPSGAIAEILQAARKLLDN